MSSAVTPIGLLAAMYDRATRRIDALDADPKLKGLRETSMASSRVWIRQWDGIRATILSEPPATYADVVTVLRHLHMIHEEIQVPDDWDVERRELHEITVTALAGCLAQIGAIEGGHDLHENAPDAFERYRTAMAWWVPSIDEGEAA